eukprot:PLAT9363.1.p1 GENE.PLAT9363.1~~PLAT9363.1.p1  ORF type:complete len:503 (+),score=104.97 PLAT9363.1:52-1560(+)
MAEVKSSGREGSASELPTWYADFSPDRPARSWREEDDRALLAAAKKFSHLSAGKRWTAVSKALNDEWTEVQCSEHYRELKLRSSASTPAETPPLTARSRSALRSAGSDASDASMLRRRRGAEEEDDEDLHAIASRAAAATAASLAATGGGTARRRRADGDDEESDSLDSLPKRPPRPSIRHKRIDQLMQFKTGRENADASAMESFALRRRSVEATRRRSSAKPLPPAFAADLRDLHRRFVGSDGMLSPAPSARSSLGSARSREDDTASVASSVAGGSGDSGRFGRSDSGASSRFERSDSGASSALDSAASLHRRSRHSAAASPAAGLPSPSPAAAPAAGSAAAAAAAAGGGGAASSSRAAASPAGASASYSRARERGSAAAAALDRADSVVSTRSRGGASSSMSITVSDGLSRSAAAAAASPGSRPGTPSRLRAVDAYYPSFADRSKRPGSRSGRPGSRAGRLKKKSSSSASAGSGGAGASASAVESPSSSSSKADIFVLDR